jgi:hypothetical protein
MFINTTLLVKEPQIILGLLNGTLNRYGSVIRDAANGQIVRHLIESPGLTNKLIALPFSPLLEGVSLITDIISQGITINKLNGIEKQLIGIEKTLSSVLQLSQIAAGASILNVGVSLAGFAYMGCKLHQIQTSLSNVQKSMEAGFNRIEERLDNLSGQLAYLHLLVEDSRQEQQRLAQAISNLHRTILRKEMAELAAEIKYRNPSSNDSEIKALKVASTVRDVMANQAMQATPKLDAEIMLNSDLAIQGWAVATAVEANLLLENGKPKEASDLLALEVPRFREVSVKWAKELIHDKRPELATVYRFTAPRFKEYISAERVKRIANISCVDNSLSAEQIRRKKNEVEVEFDMSYSSQFDETWTHRQIAIAEYLDAISELLARLDSLLFFAELCEKKNIKSIRNILPDSNAELGFYVLPHSF